MNLTWVVTIPDHESITIMGARQQAGMTLEEELKAYIFFKKLDIFFIYISNFKCYPESLLYPPPSTAPLPTHSRFLALAFPCTGEYKVCKTKRPLFPVMANQATFCYICSQRHELRGYWLVHIVVPPIGFQALQLLGHFLQLLHWGPCVPSNR